MAQVERSSIVPIIQGVQTAIIAVTGFDTSQVRITAHWPPYQQKGARIVYLWPKEEAPIREVCDGSGRRGTEVRRTLWAILDSRVALDDPGGAETWLNDPVLGTFVVEEQIKDALEGLLVTDNDDLTSESGNILQVEPFKYQGSAGPDQEAFKKLQGPPVGWGRTVFQYTFTYFLPLNQATQ
jgi:hypothetical protein